MRRAFALLSCCVLAGCGPALKLSFPPAAQSPTEPAAPVCPGGLSADLAPEPKPPAGAGFPAPQDAAASAAVAVYGQWLHAFALWGRAGWARAADAKSYCDTLKGD